MVSKAVKNKIFSKLPIVIYFLLMNHSLSVFADNNPVALDVYAYNKSACDYVYESPNISGSRKFLFIQREILRPLNGMEPWQFRQISTKLPTENKITCENAMFTIEQKSQPARSCPSDYNKTPIDVVFTYNRVFLEKKDETTSKMMVERDVAETYCVCYKEKPVVYFELSNNKITTSNFADPTDEPTSKIFAFQRKFNSTACI